MHRTTRTEVEKALKERFDTINRAGLPIHLHISTNPLPGRQRKLHHFAVHYTRIPCNVLTPDDEVECFICQVLLDHCGQLKMNWWHGKHKYGQCPADVHDGHRYIITNTWSSSLTVGPGNEEEA